MARDDEVVARDRDCHRVVGDKMMREFLTWTSKHPKKIDPYFMASEASVVSAFVEWLVMTGDGDVVLRRINDAPRQLFLPFPDEERPWKTS